MTERKIPVEPFKIKVVEPIRATGREKREAVLKDAGLNVFNIPADKYVAEALIDLYRNRDEIRGLKINYQAPHLRHFTVRLVEI